MSLRTILIIAASVLGVAGYITVRSLPRRPDFSRVYTGLFATALATALFFTIVRLVDGAEGYFWWSVPSAIFLVTAARAIIIKDRIKRLYSKPSTEDGTDLFTSPPITGATQRPQLGERTEAYIAEVAKAQEVQIDLGELSHFKFTGSGVGFLTHVLDDEQEVGCVVTTPYKGMSLADLVEIAARHECQHATVQAVAA